MSRRRSRANARKKSFPLGLLVLGLVFTAFGLGFMVTALSAPLAAVTRLSWRQVPCRVDRFVIKDDRTSDQPFSPEVSFRFQWAVASQAEAESAPPTREITGSKLRVGDSCEDDYATLAKLREEILARPTPICWVDPKDPTQAVLVRGGPSISVWLGPTIFCGCFVAIGIGVIVMALRHWRSKGGGQVMAGGNPAAREAPWLLYPAFGMFGLAGLGIFGGLVIPSWVFSVRSRGWLETSAEVVWSEVRIHHGSKSTSYHADVFYCYTSGGQEHRSNTYSFFGDPSFGKRATTQRLVAALPPGKHLICFVNPQRPWQAVLDRGIGWRDGLLSLFPLPFMAVGFFGLRWVIRKRWGSDTRRPPRPKAPASRTPPATS